LGFCETPQAFRSKKFAHFQLSPTRIFSLKLFFKRAIMQMVITGKLSRLNFISRESNILSRRGGTVRTPTWLTPGKFVGDGRSF